MSLDPAKNLSLLQSILQEQLAPVESRSIKDPSNGRFAGKLDKALEKVGVPGSAYSNSLQQTAELLRLQTLRTSLNLLEEQPVQSPVIPLFHSSINQQIPQLQSYISNLPSEDKKTSTEKPANSLLNRHEPGPRAPEKLSLLGNSKNSLEVEPLIQKAANRYGVDPGLIKAVIKAESNFNARAVSHAGAQGLMQLMPATAKGLGVTDSFNPEQNIMGGTKFLKSLLDRYNGDIDSALAAYNWGPGNVDRRPERMPRETKEYLVRVKQYYNQYQG